MASEHSVMHNTTPLWIVEYDKTWDVLGPFPIHAREQHFISPAFPLNLSKPIDYTQLWPSSCADGGTVGWTQTTSNDDGKLDIAFPEIRWKNLRTSEGWASLQHHAVLRTTLTLFPPLPTSITPPRLLVGLKQGSYFALRPQGLDISSFVPEWCAGNIYDIPRSSLHIINLPAAPSLHKPTKYDLFISGDYEIRLFGDPLTSGSDVPVQQMTLLLRVQDISEVLVRQTAQDVASDFISGFAFGSAIGVGVQSVDGWWTVTDLKMKDRIPGLNLRIKDKCTIAPSQTRVVPVCIEQSLPFYGGSLEFLIQLVSGESSREISVSIPIVHLELSTLGRQSVKGTFFFANSMPSTFIAVPPTSANSLTSGPPIVALHGAGVDILGAEGAFFVESFPEYKKNWIVVPTGRTSWGLDWHGPSADDAWASLEALSKISRKDAHGFPQSWKIPPNSQVIVIGHSNGGQGAWYVTSRYPDRVVAAVPTSGYIKSQAYVPWISARSGHFIDPALRCILESSLTPDDNDLHLSNLVDTPILAIHGGDDENVPVWHTREAFSTLKTWYPSANIQYKEDAGEGHWYSDVLNSSSVQNFLDGVSSAKATKSDDFTLTVTIPRINGSLHGWNIDQAIIPGRLSRLHVRKIDHSKFEVEPSNVQIFTVPIHDEPVEIVIDDNSVRISGGTSESTQIRQTTSGRWEVASRSKQVSQNHGRVQHILSSRGPLIIVIPAHSNHETLSVALRVAHILNVYHAFDAEIITEDVALTWNRLGAWPVGNVVFIGTASSEFAKEMLNPTNAKTDVQVVDATIHVGTRKFGKPGQGALFLHPHPTDIQSLMLFMLYTDKSALEKVARLFPFRTGVVVPDWLAVGEKMDNFGAAGVEAAGVWNNDWKLSPAMSWFER